MKITVSNSEIMQSIAIVENRIPGTVLKPITDMLNGVDFTGTVFKAKVPTGSATDPHLIVEADVL